MLSGSSSTISISVTSVTASSSAFIPALREKLMPGLDTKERTAPVLSENRFVSLTKAPFMSCTSRVHFSRISVRFLKSSPLENMLSCILSTSLLAIPFFPRLQGHATGSGHIVQSPITILQIYVPEGAFSALLKPFHAGFTACGTGRHGNVNAQDVLAGAGG